MQIHLTGELPSNFDAAFSLMQSELGVTLHPNGFPVHLRKDTAFSVDMTPAGAQLGWDKKISVWRGLQLICTHCGQRMQIRQKVAFTTLGLMLDVSRNAVFTQQTLQFFLRKMALMGYDLGMLYTEDTFEVPQYPYFGYQRGRYTLSDLKELDDYADTLGIELCPCIQTLAHLNRALKWPQMHNLRDTEDILLTDAEETYTFISAMLQSAAAPYRSRRIHIGMDEAQMLGLGRYLKQNGYRNPHEIMSKHLSRVAAMAREAGLEPMIWSDMYFRMCSPTNDYYDCNDLPAELCRQAPADISLVYWDYYHEDEPTYDRMFRLHERFPAQTCFAGGLWIWNRFFANHRKLWNTTVPALTQAKKHNIPLVLATAWMDNGAEASPLTMLYGMLLYAEYNYTGCFDKAALSERFAAVTGLSAEDFLSLEEVDHPADLRENEMEPSSISKMLLYQDPMIQLFAADLADYDLAAHYSALCEKYEKIAQKQANESYSLLFRFAAQLCKTLSLKAVWHRDAAPAIHAQDRKRAAELSVLAKDIRQQIDTLRSVWFSLWRSTNKLYGFEILDIRLGGLCARFDTVSLLFSDFADGKEAAFEPLCEDALPFLRTEDGKLQSCHPWHEIISACNIAGCP